MMKVWCRPAGIPGSTKARRQLIVRARAFMDTNQPHPLEPSDGHVARCAMPPEGWAAIQTELNLTDRETDILRCLFGGLTESEVGAALSISTHTVHTHLGRIYRKVGVHGLPGLLLRAFGTYVRSVESKSGRTATNGFVAPAILQIGAARRELRYARPSTADSPE